MSAPILPFAVWQSGTNQNSIPANDNSLRNQILNGLVISESTDAQPGSPGDGDIYIMTGSASGAQWETFDQFDLAIYDSGTWYAYAPVEGIVVNVSETLKVWNGSSYIDAASGGGGSTSVITEVASYTAELGDQVVQMNAGSANNFTVPPNSSVAFPIGWFLEVWQQGAGQTTVVAGAGVSILYDADLTLSLKGQNSGCSLRKVETDTWRLVGGMEPA